MLTAVIVDDEPKAIQSLNWELSNFDQQIKVVNTFTNPDQALEYLKDNVPDCLFLDIQMPTMDGFQFLQKLDNKNIAVIITTAYNEYAIKALKNDAIDYLLKPIDTDDLSLTVEKIKRFKKTFSADVIEDILINFTNNNSKKKITINTDGKLLFLNVDDILFAESDGNYSTIYMTDKQKILVTKKLKEVNLLLPEHLFFRIHNSYIVNLSKIKEFIKTEGYVIMESNHKIPVARQRKSEFLEKL
ncbi:MULTISPECIES: LytR/AlgR family response regulator transcription factor [Mesoflavibacter]|uniref:LytTR family DNA-binding domain-containing protein n=1 Tax=Mesoflavibacter profundi TaxID=2708110 RepID=A0ABT4S334_9FLAO|nr:MULTISPECIES: LytTR family DNA-binding domain-containing protein [Mesoflavibacter]MDA0178206.1 LytTR family DNA-binding domain-containing protein [Mesoflavibacter profundi]QIJ89168.1 Two-component transcriptional regulator, LytTR family [Mesoflavibacter sp. HG96]QIJ91896.1 Two-component transcriptional regulator, LytTR family [Mesoflavibacter sp. HG37]